MIKRINSLYFLADSKEDLKKVSAEMGSECYVIKEACEYKITSEGEWVKQNAAILSGEATDLTGYATEEYVNEALKAATHKEEDYGDAHDFGLMVKASENRTLIEAMLAKGKGMYNFHVEKGSPGQPDAVIEKNSSCRGICCVDTYRSDSNWYGWIIMFDHDGEMYSQYIRNAVPTGWKSTLMA